MLLRFQRPTGKGPEIIRQKEGEKATAQGNTGLQQVTGTPQNWDSHSLNRYDRQSLFTAYEHQICSWTDNRIDSKLDQVPRNGMQMSEDHQGGTTFTGTTGKSTRTSAQLSVFLLAK